MEQSIHNAFDSRSKNYSNEMNWILDDRFIDCFAVPVFEKGKLLDAGAGNGILAERCYEKGWDVTAVDVNEKMMQSIPDGIKRSLQSIEKLDFPDNSFDVTVCRQVLQYTDIERALSSMVRVTKKELRLGHIEFVFLEDKAFWETLFDLANPFRKHIFCHGEDFISQAVEASALSVKRIRDENFLFNDILISPMKYEKSVYDRLCEMLKAQGDNFIKRNNIRFCETGEVYCDRIWSFVVLEVISD